MSDGASQKERCDAAVTGLNEPVLYVPLRWPNQAVSHSKEGFP